MKGQLTSCALVVYLEHILGLGKIRLVDAREPPLCDLVSGGWTGPAVARLETFGGLTAAAEQEMLGGLSAEFGLETFKGWDSCSSTARLETSSY